MKVLLVGSGGREHALAWKLSQAADLSELHAAPGNPGIATLGRCHPVRAEDGEGLLGLAGSLDVDLVVVGPEAPLVVGRRRRAPACRESPCFGPSAAAARIEGSKSFAKDVMSAAGVATAAAALRCAAAVRDQGGRPRGRQGRLRLPRPDGARRRAPVRQLRFGDAIVIEELLEGEEISVFALCDGVPRARAARRAGLQARRATATADRTRAAWARSRRSRASARGDRGDPRHRPPPGARGARRNAARRSSACLFAGLMLHRRGTARPRVQLPLRRPRDAVAPPAARGRPARRARRRRRRRPLDVDLTVGRHCHRHGRRRRRRLPGPRRHRLDDRGRRRGRERRARSSSTRARRSTATGS